MMPRCATCFRVSFRRMDCPQWRPSSGADALAVLAREGDIPVCISDIYMPEMDGVTFLREAVSRYPDMAVIMLTGVAEVNTAVECLKLGALDYISKPVMVEEVRARLDKALEKRDLILQNRFYQQNLETRVRDLDRSNQMSLINGVQMLVHALEAKDAYTSGHSSRVSRYAVKAAVLLGFTGDALEHVRLGGELHDIGKIGTREDILNKPGPLTQDEFSHIKEHAPLGEKILAPFLGGSPIVLRIVRSHHERLDGSGFPDALQGDADPPGGAHRGGGGRLRCHDHQPRLPPSPLPGAGHSGAAPLRRGSLRRRRGRGVSPGLWQWLRRVTASLIGPARPMSDTLMISVSGIRGHVGIGPHA